MIRQLLLPPLAAAILLSVACGDTPQVDIEATVEAEVAATRPDLEATVEAQVAARLDAQATIQAGIAAGIQATVQAQPSPTPTATHTPTVTPTHTPVPTNTPTPIPTVTPTYTPVPTNTPTPSPLPTAAPTITNTPLPAKPAQWDVAPPMRINASKQYSAVFTMERGGTFEVDLFADKAPKTVNNFVFLVREGFYNGATFHRVIPGFMAQGGDPTGTGIGGPGYDFDNEFHPDLRHSGPGILAMANAGMSGGRGTNGSQFYITYSQQHRLDGLNLDGTPKPCQQTGVSCHSVFGQVVQGMDVVIGIRSRDPQTAATEATSLRASRSSRSSEPSPSPLTVRTALLLGKSQRLAQRIIPLS